jgi:signal transduction histidine kinase
VYANDLEKSNKLKDLFADIMRHDLLNPIGVIKNVFELMEDDIDDSYKEEVEIVQKNFEKIEELIQTLTRFGMVESSRHLEFENLNVTEIIGNVAEGLRKLTSDNTAIIIPTTDYFAQVNVFIEDVFLNLLSNAIKYGPSNSKVVVEVEDNNDYLKFKIIDSGPGVPDEHKKSIFERFKRVDKGSVKGSGLGLAIVKKVVELHQGDVWVEDNPNGGSVFIFKLPKKRKKDA